MGGGSRSSTLLCLSATVLGCGTSPVGDGGVNDAGQDDAPAPSIPWLAAGEPPLEALRLPWRDAGVPVLEWPCAPGWHERIVDGLAVCSPYAGDGPDECAPGEAHFPGEPGCRPLGEPCGEGPFADASDLEPATLLHVDQSSEPGGDGAAGTPFATLAAAFDAATDGTTVLLAAGRYVVDRVWPSGSSVRGRCVARTSLAAPDFAGTRTAVVETGPGRAGFRIKNVTVGPAPLAGVEVRGRGGVLSLDEIRIAATTTRGLYVVEGAEARVRDLGVTGTVSSSDGTLGRGVHVASGGQLTVQRGLLRANQDSGVFAEGVDTTVAVLDVAILENQPQSGGSVGGGLHVEQGAWLLADGAFLHGNLDLGVGVMGRGTTALLFDIALVDTRPGPRDPRFGMGIVILDGAALTVERGLLRANRVFGLLANGAGTTATLTDVAVLDTMVQQETGAGGRGLLVQFGAELTLERGVLRRNREIGVFVYGADTFAGLTDVAVLDTQARPADGALGRGLDISEGARLSLERGVLRGNRDVGVFVAGNGTSATLTDVAVVDTQAEASGTGGRGLDVERGAALHLERGIVQGNRDIGVFANGDDATVAMVDVAVLHTLPVERSGFGGRGVHVQRGATLTVDRGLVRRNHEVGVFVGEAGTTASLTDVAILDTLAQPADGTLGRGLSIQGGAVTNLERGLLRGNRITGVFVHGSGTRASLTHVVVLDTHGQESDGETVANVGAFSDADVEIVRFLLADASLCGVQLATDASVRLTDGVVRGHPIGVCLQRPDYPRELLRQNVAYDNATNVEATNLPLQDPADVLAPLADP
ncbi:MAG: hypothetical protein ACFCGT_04860 [Sandaracinaceae bacterium]